MASNEKVINMKNLRLVETVDFDIKIVLIQARMQSIEPKQGQGQKLQSYFGQTEWMLENLSPDTRCTRIVTFVTFDVGGETFGSLSTPPSVQDDDGPPELTVLGRRLCLCVFHECRPPTRSDADPYCIWRLACRESEQWEKLYRVLHPQTLRPELDLLRVHWVYPLETYLAGNGRKKIMFATEEGVLAFDLDGGGVPVPKVLVSPTELVSARYDDEEATITRGTVGLLEESLVPVGRTSEEVIFSSPWRKAWSDVLKWMPAQSVAALTCVCREWRAVAETDRFVRTHALHANLKWSLRVMVV
uniref:F-box domain-containing protein n=1 Tax=Aegilops tauschii TaxID=37682 RepID=M8AHF7_AEGTA